VAAVGVAVAVVVVVPVIVHAVRSGDSGGAGGDDLGSGRWRLVSLTHDGRGEVLARDYLLTFVDDTHFMVSYRPAATSGTYEVEGDTLTMEEVSANAIDLDLTESDRAVEALYTGEGGGEARSTFVLDGDTLVLDHDRWHYVFERTQGTAPPSPASTAA
jgi:hypothetical protein